MSNEHWHWQEPGGAWKGVGLYHITLKIPSREPLLGDIVIPDNDPTKAYVKHLPLGDALLLCLRDFPNHHPEIQVLHYCLMPDHLHMIWYVRRAMPKGIRMVVSGFRSAAQKLGRAFSYYDALAFSTVAPTASRENYQENTLRKQLGNEAYYALSPIFTEMPHIRPMGQRRQLPTTLRYIDMNPQRLATKRLMPGFFRRVGQGSVDIRFFDSSNSAGAPTRSHQHAVTNTQSANGQQPIANSQKRGHRDLFFIYLI